MSGHTKGELEFLNVLMSAWVGGWYAGIDGAKTDHRKRADCFFIMKENPQFTTTPDLLAACELLLKTLLEAGYDPEIEEAVTTAKTAIAKAK